MNARKTVLSAAIIAALVVSTGCGDSDSPAVAGDSGTNTAGDTSTAAPKADFSLQILHFSDMDGSDATALNSVAGMSTLINRFRAERPDTTVVLSSGDNYIPGPRFTAADDDSFATPALLGTAGPGRADIAMVNALGVQASAVGNHELDTGTGGFAGLISAEDAWTGAGFPYLAYNIDFTTDAATAGLVAANGVDAASLAGKLAGWTTISVDGQTIGVIGAGSPTFPAITSTGGLTVSPGLSGGAAFDVQLLAAELQRGVDEMRAAGLNKIVMLAHMQTLSVERQLASLLDGVDVIVAGGSNTLLADADDALRQGDSAADTYPLQLTSATGEPVVVLNTDADYKYLGRFVAPFDADGVLLPALFDASINGAYATPTDEPGPADDAGADGAVVAMRDAVNNYLATRDGNVLGTTSVFLEGRRAAVRNQETNLGNLTADANLWYAQQAGFPVQVSLKNGGGIRAEIGQVLAPPGAVSADDLTLLPPPANPNTDRESGEISQIAIEIALRFNNSLWVFDITATQLKELLEHGVAQLGSQGRFPQVGGIAFSYDPAEVAQVVTDGSVTTPGSRIRSLRVGSETVVAGGSIVGDPNRVFRMVSLGFLAGGGDGYPFPDPLPNLVRLEELGLAAGTADFAPAGTEQDALAEYLRSEHPDAANAFAAAETPASDDLRIQDLSQRQTDTVLQP